MWTGLRTSVSAEVALDGLEALLGEAVVDVAGGGAGDADAGDRGVADRDGDAAAQEQGAGDVAQGRALVLDAAGELGGGLAEADGGEGLALGGLLGLRAAAVAPDHDLDGAGAVDDRDADPL